MGGRVNSCLFLAWILAAVFLVSAAAPPPLPAGECEMVAAGGPLIAMDFDNVDILLFIKFISELTGENFVVDKAVSGKVTVMSPRGISVHEAYKVFESVLEVNGLATVHSGEIIKIMPSAEARSRRLETRLAPGPPDGSDRLITQLIPLAHANPVEIQKIFAPFVSRSSVVAAYPPTGILIVADLESNIQRLLKIVEAIDVEGSGEKLAVMPLEHAVAAGLARTMNTLFQSRAQEARKTGRSDAVPIKIVPEERTNTLIVLASEADMERVGSLVAMLDKQTPPGEGDIRVVYLQHGNAEDLAGVLMAMPATRPGERPEPGKAPVISPGIRVVADTATNSLVITAGREDYMVIENVIRQLDIPRRMVYIEALIMEVSVNKTLSMGTEWRFGEDRGSHRGRTIGVFGGSSPASPILGSGGLPSGFSLGVLGDTISIGGEKFFSMGALIRFMGSEQGVQILSTPQIMTTDNEEARIQVVETRPFLTRMDTSAATDRDYSTYEYRDVGVSLTIKPQINHEGYVRLRIEQEVSQIIGDDQTFRPSTLKRLARTTVIVKDGNTIVIGGLIDDIRDRGDYRVPCLAGLPVLGWAFRSSTRSEDAKNLFIFITPHIVENQQDAARVHDVKREEMDRIREGALGRPPGGELSGPGD